MDLAKGERFDLYFKVELYDFCIVYDVHLLKNVLNYKVGFFDGRLKKLYFLNYSIQKENSSLAIPFRQLNWSLINIRILI